MMTKSMIIIMMMMIMSVTQKIIKLGISEFCMEVDLDKTYEMMMIELLKKYFFKYRALAPATKCER